MKMNVVVCISHKTPVVLKELELPYGLGGSSCKHNYNSFQIVVGKLQKNCFKQMRIGE
jgi:hypothetical protein